MMVEVLLIAITVLLGIIAWFIKGYHVANNMKHDNTNHRLDVVREESEADMKSIRSTFKALKCVEVSNQVNKLAGTIGTFVKQTEKNMDRHDKEIVALFKHKDNILKEMSNIRVKSGIEARDSETREFKKNFINIECLLVDDNDGVRDVMAETIKEKMGFKVTPVCNIAEAFDAMSEKDYDCAIVDYYIGEQEAPEFIQRCYKENKLIKQNNGSKPTVKAVIYTGKENAKIPAGINSLEKPFEWDDMRKLIECVLTE